GTGVDPHLYKASAGDVKKLSRAEIIFYNGLHLEGKITDILAQMNKRGIFTVAVAERIDNSRLLTSEYFQGYYDPHIWFDVILWKSAVEVVRDSLSKYDEKNKDVYFSNAEVYLKKLDELHRD
ncbi:MAG: zinc ABC transporter solute-binding protein, partial [Candidatus Dadabacteria bacterium]|nr:zinc ABC transporter solute-binding protein [Candidatus Dadabacteria bacterium]NIQ14996.1 zinc ABC transporter solute-binding protein [Candidatus Dadabacteria bacterium]